jgi:hypothetical protein
MQRRKQIACVPGVCTDEDATCLCRYDRIRYFRTLKYLKVAVASYTKLGSKLLNDNEDRKWL